MAEKLEIKWDKRALGLAIGTAPETLEAVTEATNQILSNAQSMSSGFRTEKYKDKGDTPAKYSGDVRSYNHAHVGVIYTANYSAQKENWTNNTLLKAVGTHG